MVTHSQEETHTVTFKLLLPLAQRKPNKDSSTSVHGEGGKRSALSQLDVCSVDPEKKELKEQNGKDVREKGGIGWATRGETCGSRWRDAKGHNYGHILSPMSHPLHRARGSGCTLMQTLPVCAHLGLTH